MGMTIDESIKNLVLIKKLEDSLGNISGNTNSVASRSLGCAIETMRKYQKIEQVISDWINDDLVGMSDYWMGRIKEVIEDGNID